MDGTAVPATSATAPVALSVIIPILDEEASLPELVERLLKTLRQVGESYEVIIVDDGSTDGGPDFLRAVVSREPHLTLIRLLGHFGQHAAISAGIERSRGEVVVLMDGDLQADPEAIPSFLAKVREGYDLVSGWRTHRADLGPVRRRASALITWLINRTTGTALHDHNCGFKAMTRRLAAQTQEYGQMRRFLPALMARLARSVAEIPVSNQARRRGGSRYSWMQLVGLTLEFAIEFSGRPFQVVGGLGLGALAVAVAGSGGYLAARLAGMPAMNRLLAFLVLLGFSGLQFTVLGLLGEYIIRIYHATQHLPLFVIDEVLTHDGGRTGDFGTVPGGRGSSVSGRS
jgi:hypothetical protein